MSARVRYVVKSPDGTYRSEHRGAVIGFDWVVDPLAAALMSKADAAGCVAHMNRISQPEDRGYAVERIEVPLIEQTAHVRDALAEVTRLRAVLAEIAALQTEEPEGRAGMLSYAEQCGLFKAASMARAGLVKP